MPKRNIEEYECEVCGLIKQVPEDHNCFKTPHPLRGWFTLGRYQLNLSADNNGAIHDAYICSMECMHEFIANQPEGDF